jgi:glycerate-2-kinase
VVLIATGKAASPMARAAYRRLGNRIRAGLVVGVEAAPAAEPVPFETVVGGHPVPTAASEQGGRRALELAASLRSGETLLVLL